MRPTAYQVFTKTENGVRKFYAAWLRAPSVLRVALSLQVSPKTVLRAARKLRELGVPLDDKPLLDADLVVFGRN